MKRSCGKGREDNVFSRKRITPALLLAAFLISVSVLSFSPIAIGGEGPPQGLNEPLFWDEDRFILGQDFVVEPNQTLFISAGVNVFFGENRGMDVKGKVVANGTVDEPIQFTIDPGSYLKQWRSLAFIEDKGSVLNHVIMNTVRTGVYISSSSPRFVNSDIWVTRSAVVVDSRIGPDSNPVFENCSIFSGMPHFDFDVSGISWVTALNTSFNETKTRIGDPTAHLERQWFLDVHSENSMGEPIEGADVNVVDNANGTASVVVPTNVNGVAEFMVTEYVDHFGFFGENRTYYTPHSYSASKLGYEDSSKEVVWIDTNGLVNVTLHDREAPVTTLLVSSPEYDQDPTYIGAITELSFEIGPGGRQPVTTRYIIDGGSLLTYTGTPFTLQGEGNHSIDFFSFDPAGNVESAKSELLYLDTTPPSITATLNPLGEGSHPIVIESETAFSLESSDEGSDVSIIEYSVNGEAYQRYFGATRFSFPKSYNVTFRAQDHIGNSANGEIWFIIVTPVPPVVNNPPSFIGTPVEDGVVGREYAYLATAVDADYDVLSYSLVNFPVGMGIDSATGFVTWTPAEDQIGQNLIMIAVSDGVDSDVQIFYIRVQEAEEGADDFLLIMGAIGVTMAIIGSSIGATEYGRFRFFLYFLVPLYSKLNKEKVLNQFLRGQIFGYIMAYPGENYTSIKKALNVENGTLTHHLYILEREGFVTSRIDGRYKRFYPTGISTKEKVKTSMIQKAILKMIRQNPNMTQTEIAEALETSKQVVNYHVKSLVNDGLLSVSKNGSSLEYQDLSRKHGD